MSPRVLILNGPNLNMLGIREPDVYGRDTLGDIEDACRQAAEDLDLDLEFRQSNAEAELIEWAQAAREACDGIIINAAGYTHTSVALRDALQFSELPVIEVHLSNVFSREEFRHRSYISDIARGVICGFGSHGSLLAVEAMARLLRKAE